MSAILLVCSTLLLAPLFIILTLRRIRSNGLKRTPPPGPRAYPIIGNLHLLGKLPHQSLHQLSKSYGPIMSMKLGHFPAVVVSSPSTAELFLKTHDSSFASRPPGFIADHFHYGTKGIILTPYGTYWRNVRRLCTVKLLNAVKVDSFSGSRMGEIKSLVGDLRDASNKGQVVDLSRRVSGAIENMVCLMVVGRKSDDKFKLNHIIHEAAQLAGAFNIGEYIPYVNPFDLQGFNARIKSASKAFDEVLETLIDDHERGGILSENEDFIDVLLSLVNKPVEEREESLKMIERTNMKAILVDMIGAAMDTTTSAVEWAFSELMRNPRVMKKLQNELLSAVGCNRLVEESDMPNLPYFDMVLKETFRLHPPGPLLVPRESMEDMTINGYFIKKGTRVIVNVWSIGRNPSVWPEKTKEFYPERFLGSNVDVQGQDFALIPFGSGRRGCPGMKLGLTTFRIVLAQLVHCFDWKLDGQILPEDLDMTEIFGLAMPRAKHLLVLPTYRLRT